MKLNGLNIISAMFNGQEVSKALRNGVTVWNETIAPIAPEYLMESTVTQTSIEVIWMDNMESDLAGYNVYLNGVKKNTSLVTQAIYNFTSLVAGTQYLIEVSAVDTNGYESVKSSVTVTTTAAPQTPTVLASDSFNRANNTNTLGVADTGQTWVTIPATSKNGILNNRAYPSLFGAGTGQDWSLSYLPLSDSNAAISEDVVFANNEGVAVRLNPTDVSYFLARISSTGLALFRISSSSASLGSYAFTPVVGATYNIKVVPNGSDFTVYLDGVQRFIVSDTMNQSLTNHGFRFFGSLNGQIDNIKAEAI